MKPKRKKYGIKLYISLLLVFLAVLAVSGLNWLFSAEQNLGIALKKLKPEQSWEIEVKIYEETHLRPKYITYQWQIQDLKALQNYIHQFPVRKEGYHYVETWPDKVFVLDTPVSPCLLSEQDFLKNLFHEREELEEILARVHSGMVSSEYYLSLEMNLLEIRQIFLFQESEIKKMTISAKPRW